MTLIKIRPHCFIMPLTRNHRIRRLHSLSGVGPPTIPCSFPGCRRSFFNNSGLTQHTHKQHPRLRRRSSESASPISPPTSPPVVSPVRRRVGSYSSPSEISSPGNQNVTPLRANSPNITITVTPLSSPNITPLNSPVLPINSPFHFEFPSSPPGWDRYSIDEYDVDHDAADHWQQPLAGVPHNPDEALENPVLPVPPLKKTCHSIINGKKACSIDLCS